MGGAMSDLTNKMKKVSLDESTEREPVNSGGENHTTEETQGLNTSNQLEALAKRIEKVSLEGEVGEEVIRTQDKREEEEGGEIPKKQLENVDDGKPDLAEEVVGEELAQAEDTDSGAGSDGDDASDEDEKNEFQPVIQLPPLVQEDDEVALLTIVEYRAKLYRFDSVASQWKERGVGSIKLLESTVEANKFRVVMWRDAIGTVACNFSLFPDISIKNFQNDPKVLCWQCFDCSEEPRWETLTCRFGTEEKCSDFKEKMLQYAKLQAPPAKIEEEKLEETNDSSCEGCRGCSPDTYEFPATATVLKEPLIDCTLGADSYSGSPRLLLTY
ncbi:E3 SUMO-protein ligase RanBP2 [Orchesella cincta]|uniref:E3 SUMO-protein ligase RanBP2 n=1 Tax=Orchesella cincta TaxID=48709 RepID=A0A1D2MJJ7_ORCCI|nr:E3 SUMO-protein ligase RanBP2 [Orchesella cincta]